jgi:hypothetical protein
MGSLLGNLLSVLRHAFRMLEQQPSFLNGLIFRVCKVSPRVAGGQPLLQYVSRLSMQTHLFQLQKQQESLTSMKYALSLLITTELLFVR